MSEPAIQVRGLGKRYTVATGDRPRYRTLRESVASAGSRVLRRIKGSSGASSDFWALRDVSFDIQPGEAVGIIGRNGAGKSTLLKILSRITRPTEGSVEIAGRVGSLLEVGTGFHPELTGRENIYLNGAILGMSRADIARRFDEIVAFAEVERFLDTPVKRYSSGMYMRLAFAVAAHLETEVLVVDEVLAVGDGAFQKKCLGKMKDVTTAGRTVLFVSHNMDAILRLCQRAILLEGGRVKAFAPVQEAISRYLHASMLAPSLTPLRLKQRAAGLPRKAVLLDIEMPAIGDQPAWHVPFGEPIALQVWFETYSPLAGFEIGVSVLTQTGVEVISTLSPDESVANDGSAGRHVMRIRIPNLWLAPGPYRVSLGIRSEHGMEDHVPEAADFEIDASLTSASKRVGLVQGLLVPNAEVDFQSEPSHPQARLDAADLSVRHGEGKGR